MIKTNSTAINLAKPRALRIIAIFEAIKGIAVLAASVGLISLLHRDFHQIAIELIGHFDLNPNARYPLLLLHYADVLHDVDLRSVVLLAVGYISVRLLEAYGLWNDLAWAEWLGALSGGLYIPLEIHHLLQHASIAGLCVLTGNFFVVGFLVLRLWRRRCESLRLKFLTIK